jgi:hypothetical protein
LPSDEEIEKVVFNFKKQRAPDLDGLTLEVVQKGWEWIKRMFVQ